MNTYRQTVVLCFRAAGTPHPSLRKVSDDHLHACFQERKRTGSKFGELIEAHIKDTKPSTSRHCPAASGIGRLRFLGFAAPVSKTKLFLKSIISMGWDGGFIESVWECYIILGVSVFHEHSNLNLFIHTWWKSHFPFFLFRLQEGKLVPANITVEPLIQVCCRWWISEIRDGESFLANSDNFHSQETGHWVMH